MKQLIVLIVLVLLLSFGTSLAQEPVAQVSKGEFTLFGNISIPTGDFGDDKGEDAGSAEMGFGVGIEYSYPLSQPELSWVTSASILLNGMDASDIEAELKYYYGSSVDIDMDRYYNIPIFTGLKYQAEVSPTLSIYGIGQVGLNIFKAPNFELTMLGESGEATFELSKSFGYGIGGGLVINNNINIGLRIYGLGEPEFEGEVKVLGTTEPIEDLEQPVSLFLINVGIKF